MFLSVFDLFKIGLGPSSSHTMGPMIAAACVETMRQTGRDMNERYKETSLGGLAVNVAQC